MSEALATQTHRFDVEWDQDPSDRRLKIWRLSCPCGKRTGWVSQRHGPGSASKTAVRQMDDHLQQIGNQP